MSVEEKRCRICGDPKPLTEFNRDSRAVDGHRGECRDCQNSYRRKVRRGERRRSKPKELGKMAYCESVPGPNKWMYQDKYFKHFAQSMGLWPPGSIWQYQDKRLIVWGTGEDQYTKELPAKAPDRSTSTPHLNPT